MIRTVCNDCGNTSQHPTRSEAFLAMDIHEYDHACAAGYTVYVWQQFCTTDGWVNYRAPAWGNTV